MWFKKASAKKSQKDKARRKASADRLAGIEGILLSAA